MGLNVNLKEMVSGLPETVKCPHCSRELNPNLEDVDIERPRATQNGKWSVPLYCYECEGESELVFKVVASVASVEPLPF